MFGWDEEERWTMMVVRKLWTSWVHMHAYISKRSNTMIEWLDTHIEVR